MSFDEMYDEMLHDEFRTGSSRQPSSRTARGLARYRTAALVSAGGLACATAGAFLGGLGGYFTVSPVSASPVHSSSTEVPLAAAASTAFHALQSAAPAAKVGGASSSSSVSNDAPGGAVATFAAAVGPLLNGIAPLTGPVASGGGSGDTVGVPPVVTGGGTTAPQNTLTQAGQILSLSLNQILGNLTAALNDITTLPANPSGAITGLIAPLTGVLTDVTGTLSDLSSLMPLPTLPTGSLPVVSALAPVAGTSHPTVAATGSGKPSPTISALAPVLNGVAATLGSTGGSILPPLPSLPLPSASGAGPTLPSLPVTTPAGTLPALPIISLPVPVTLPVPTVSKTSTGGTCVALPTPALPVTVNLPIKLGPISVGVKTGGASSGATVCAG